MNLINFLLTNGKVTYKTLSYEFHLSVKTIKEYLFILNDLFPICTYYGRYGGIEINKSCTLGGLLWNKNELKIILEGLILLKEKEPQNIDVIKVINKLGTIGLNDDRKHIQND